MPRFRFTIRQLLVTVAITAVVLFLAIHASKWREPFPVPRPVGELTYKGEKRFAFLVSPRTFPRRGHYLSLRPTLGSPYVTLALFVLLGLGAIVPPVALIGLAIKRVFAGPARGAAHAEGPKVPNDQPRKPRPRR